MKRINNNYERERKHFGKILKKNRMRIAMSLRDVELATGISNAHLSQIETGKIKNPSFWIVCKLFKLYHIGLDNFPFWQNYPIKAK